MGGHGFDPGPWHTKVVKNGTSCSSLSTQTYRVELWLVNPVSVWCDWVWYHAKCLGHDTSNRQHYNSDHGAPCHKQTPSWYDWKIVESDVKPDYTHTYLLIFYYFFNLRNRSALAVNCWVIIYCLEVSCKGDQITSAKRKWIVYLQLTDKQWIITQQFTQ